MLGDGPDWNKFKTVCFEKAYAAFENGNFRKTKSQRTYLFGHYEHSEDAHAFILCVLQTSSWLPLWKHQAVHDALG
jgi:hypothetical protein